MRCLLVGLVLLALSLAPSLTFARQTEAATSPIPPAYSIAELPGLGGEASRAFAINNRSQIVGHADDEQGRRRAVLWQDGRVIDLGTLGGDHATAQNITDAGLIVGRSTLTPGGTLDTMPAHAFAWQDGQMSDLGTLGGDFSLALAANDAGQIVGESTTTPGLDPERTRTEAFLWANGEMKGLGTLGGTFSSALGITDDGQVVGQSKTATGEMRAFLWVNGSMTSLGALTGTSSTAIDMNDSGQIVGGWSKVEGEDRAALWDGDQALDLETHQGTWAFALDINDRGWVVGTQEGQTPSGERWGSSFLWSDRQGWDLRDLLHDTPPWGLWGANGINEAGQIVGYGKLDDRIRAFVMTPIENLCDGVAAWNSATQEAMKPFYDVLEPTGFLRDAQRKLTPSQWQDVFEASKQAAGSLNAITPPPAREAWHAAQLQMVLVYGLIAKANLEKGNDAPSVSVATLVKVIVDMDQAMDSSPRCPPAAEP